MNKNLIVLLQFIKKKSTIEKLKLFSDLENHVH